MTRLLSVLCGMALGGTAWAAPVLIVADEFPAMQVLAGQLKSMENLDCQAVAQTNLPPDLAAFRAVIVYLHRDLHPAAEQACIAYARAGGRLIPLHHSISSGKRKNKDWFKFLGVSLPAGEVTQGGYKWVEGVTLQFANLAPQHFITTHKVPYPGPASWKPPGLPAEAKPPGGFTLEHTEVYLNHALDGERTLLLGFKYTDAKSGQTYLQNHAGWLKPAGKGWIVYLMPGHSTLDFENAVYARLVANAVVWQP